MSALSQLVRSLGCVFLVLSMSMPLQAASRSDVEEMFGVWLKKDLWPDAKREGISSTVFNQALAGAKLRWDLPDLVPPGTKPPAKREQSQAEFRSPAAYFHQDRLNRLADYGRDLAKKWHNTIGQIEKRYGVPGRIILAIWGKETSYGRAKLGNSALRVLATKAFMSTRQELFRKELLAALQILQRGYISKGSMQSSWAGALGQPQFMPSVYLKYAVDFDGDGRRDIWNSIPDTMASIANYLSKSGWHSGRDWGFEVVTAPNVFCGQEGQDRARPVSEWVEHGISRINGKPFPTLELDANGMMLVPAGIYGPKFIVTPNFYVLKEYNNSDLYALYIGNLADRIAYNSGPFMGEWGDVGRLLRSDIARMQRKLEKEGYDVGGADGLPGYKTRRSIGEWQQKRGIKPGCFPTPDLVPQLR